MENHIKELGAKITDKSITTPEMELYVVLKGLYDSFKCIFCGGHGHSIKKCFSFLMVGKKLITPLAREEWSKAIANKSGISKEESLTRLAGQKRKATEESIIEMEKKRGKMD